VLVDKPASMSSHDVVQAVRGKFAMRAVGHTGTLDPFATGLLVILLGRATRLARYVEAQPKRYVATARLGVQTTTDDLTGEMIAASPTAGAVPDFRVLEELSSFQGAQLQVPPQYSAKQVGGQRSYRKARRGEVVDLEPVPVTIHSIELLQYAPPDLTFRTVVSAGTYIRAIARDLGERLGVGAHLIALRREAIGSLLVDEAVTPEQLGPAAVLPPHAVLRDLPQVDLDEPARIAVSHGRAVADEREARKRGSGEAVALVEGGELIAVARAEDGWLRPTVVLETK
jgi:tRNA pseudouridine55 synthase